MAKYKAYPEYKDSGDSNIGVIPTHWELKKLKHLTKCLDGSRIPLNATQRGEMQGVIPYWGANNIVDYVNAYLFDEELVLLGEDGAPFFDKNKDVAFHITGKIWPNNHVHVLRPKLDLTNAKFLAYAINCTDFSLHISGSTRDKLNQSDMDNINIRYCDRNEQDKISFFLDHETAKIDNLIEKQQQLIELLKEKCQAVISHAVTKGLNPDVPMKDSGVEWLGEVPDHWAIKPLRYLGDCQNGINIGAEAFGSGFPFVSYGDAYKNRVLPDNGSGLVQSTAEDRKKYSLLRGDVLFTRTSETIEEIGFASACIKSIENACFAGFLIRFRPESSDLCVEYSKYYFSNQLLRIFFTKEMNLITRASLSQDLLKMMPVVIPPVDEQEKIAELLDNISEKFDQLQLLGEEQIKYLQERRTALISAAVTGKIDVRDWVTPDTQDVEEPQEATA
ncbi:type I restriction enzyme S subunit [Gibbsiella quercinecans]|nr:restriction endonuclease subunit S [Gibbsiella quercinecans]TCT89284.1 type I restriction enzyme S subunit [Gibbsiella quercinecans]